MTALSFADAVARISGEPIERVTEVLADAGVPTVDKASSPVPLRLTHLTFSGTKVDVPNAGDFVFDQPLTDGLWALCTDKNDAGKTSVFEIVTWALRGERRKQLQKDVVSWLKHIEVTGTVDGDQFVVAFDTVDGKPSGSLTTTGGSYDFESDATFKAVMSAFMMEHLRLASFETWNKSNQAAMPHEWSAYSTGLYLPREGLSAVIGDTAEGGMANRLLLMFIGIRWASTLVACQVALKGLAGQVEQLESASAHVRSAMQEALDVREAELDEARKALAALPASTVSLDDIATAQQVWEDRISDYSAAYQAMLTARSTASAAKSAASDAKKRLQDRKEAAQTRRFLNGLSPTTCPRCTIPIGEDRKENESVHDRCAVCDREVDLANELDDDDDVAELEALTEQVDQVVEDADDLLRRSEEADVAEREALDAREAAKQEYRRLRSYTANETVRREAEQAVERLEAVVAQLRDLSEPAKPAGGDGNREELERRLALLKVAVKEADTRVKVGYAEIIAAVNAGILELGQKFGFESLQHADLRRNATLPVKKGGQDTSFSYCTPGERLRLRIAVVIALLRVASEQNIGRHPGLLLIDSIGAEETEHGDLAEFMRSLRAVTDDLGIQTIVASARSEILEHVDPNQQVVATGDAYLW